MTAKSVWIDVDSVHSSLLTRAMADGTMPNLAKLGQAGCARQIDYEVPFQTAAWATAHTGLSVADHGAIAFERGVPDTYRFCVDIQQVAPGSTYWETLGKFNKRTLIANSINPILTPGLNGVQVAYWSTHVAGRTAKSVSFPPEIIDDLESSQQGPGFAMSDWGSARKVNSERFAEAISDNLARKAQAFGSLIERQHWDHVHVGFDDLHSLGHVLWSRFDHPLGRPVIDGALSDLDDAIGTVLDRAGDGAAALVVAIGGIGPLYAWSHLVDEIIARFEGGGAPPSAIYGPLGKTWAAAPVWLRMALAPLKTRLREAHLASKRRLSRAFAFPLNEESGGIRINLRGREPFGTVAPGKECQELMEQLRDGLLELHDPESGMPLVSQVWFTRELVATGTSAKFLPDLMIKWNCAKPLETVEYERLGRIELDFWSDRVGDHHVDGLLVSNRMLASSRNGTGGISVLDLAPTVAALHGVEPRDDWRGTSLLEERRQPSREPVS